MAGLFTASGSLRAKASCAKLISIVLLALRLTQAAPSIGTGQDLWSNPCSNRHTRSTAEKELKFSITTLDHDMFKQLKSLYPKNLKKVKGNCPRLNRLIEPIKNASNLTVAHQKFHLSLIEFAVFLEKLKDMEINTSTQFDFDKRRTIYKKTESTLRLTICEFNETLLNELKVKPNVGRPPRVNTKCLPKKADLSQIQMLDMQFFKKLKRLFKQGRRTLKKLKKNNKSSKSVKLRHAGSIRTKS